MAEEIGVEFAFPTKTVHVDSFYKDEPRQISKKPSEEELVATVYAFGPKGKLAKPEGVKIKKEGQEINFNPSH